MVCFWAQLIAMGRNEGFEGWMQLLVIVIVVVGYALSSILKAKAKRVEEQEGQERQPGLAYPGVSAVQPPATEATRPRPVVEKTATAVRQAMRAQAVEAVVKPKLAPTPQLEVKFPEVPELKVEGLLESRREVFTEAGLKAASVPVLQEVALAESLLDYRDPAELRRAILHYEILGKPLSLRGPGEQIIGL